MAARKKKSNVGRKALKGKKTSPLELTRDGQEGAGAARGRVEVRGEVRAVGRKREGEGSQQVGVMGEALEMLPFPQEQTKHPCIASSYSFFHVLPPVDYLQAAADERGLCTRAEAQPSRALAK